MALRSQQRTNDVQKHERLKHGGAGGVLRTRRGSFQQQQLNPCGPDGGNTAGLLFKRYNPFI